MELAACVCSLTAKFEREDLIRLKTSSMKQDLKPTFAATTLLLCESSKLLLACCECFCGFLKFIFEFSFDLDVHFDFSNFNLSLSIE